jgi:hypothetical protein
MLTDEPMVGVGEIARMLDRSEQDVRRLAREGVIPGHKLRPTDPKKKVRTHWRFYKSEVREHLNTQRTPGWNQSPQSRGRKRVA